uniref:Uncharacterized protein n=1 Tax=Eutreptiella gymnastica TaxID=73025 RepID=A0A7S4CX74_9EUGL
MDDHLERAEDTVRVHPHGASLPRPLPRGSHRDRAPQDKRHPVAHLRPGGTPASPCLDPILSRTASPGDNHSVDQPRGYPQEGGEFQGPARPERALGHPHGGGLGRPPAYRTCSCCGASGEGYPCLPHYTAALQAAVGSGAPSLHCRTAQGSVQRGFEWVNRRAAETVRKQTLDTPAVNASQGCP